MLKSVYAQLTIELFLGFIGLLIAVKIIGRRQFQQISPFDFISAIVLGELLGNAIYDNEVSILHVLYAIAVWTVLLFVTEKAVQKSRKLRRAVEGSPVLLIDKGVINYQVMSKERLDFVELLSLLRDKGVTVREVEYAILEHNGLITIIKKPPYDQVTKKDLNIALGPVLLNIPLIIEGEIIAANLKHAGHDEAWLQGTLKQQQINDINDVLYAEWNDAEGLHVQKK